MSITRPRLAFLLSCALLLGFLLGSVIGAEPQTKFSLSEYEQQIVRNTQHMQDIERDVQKLQDWHEQHARDDLKSSSDLSADLREIKVKVEKHEQIIWLIVALVIAIIVKIVAEFISTRRGTWQGKREGTWEENNSAGEEDHHHGQNI